MKDDEVKFGGTGQGKRNAEEVANHFACLIPTRVCRGSVRRGILRIKMKQLNLEGSWKLEEHRNTTQAAAHCFKFCSCVT